MNDDTLSCPGCGITRTRIRDAYISPFEVIFWFNENSVLVRCQVCGTEMEVNRIPAMR